MPNRQELVLKAMGLVTYRDRFSSAPEGSLNTAKNIVIDKNGIMAPRRGFEALDGTTENVTSIHHYQDTLIIHQGTTGSEDTLSYYTAPTWTDYSGTWEAPDGAEVIRSVKANKNLYFATNTGVQKLDDVTGSITDAGAPEALDVSGVATATVGGFLPTLDSVAYRVVWGYRDANDNLILGAPSGRAVVNNAGVSDASVDLTIAIPADKVDATWFYQIYRSTAQTVDEPTDELQLVFEANPTASEITAEEITVNDNTSDSLRGADLYTNASQEGIAQENAEPPQCVDMALFQNYMFYANTKTKQNLTFTLLATGTGALVADDTVTISIGATTYVFTAKAVPTLETEFELVTSGGLGANIAATARSLVSAVNKLTANDKVWAFYDSAANELPGRMRIVERDFNILDPETDFSVEADTSDLSFSPNINTGGGGTGSAEDSTNDNTPNRLFYSKIQEPEAVPTANFFDVGASNSTILRIVPNRSTLLIFKEDGIYRLTGTSADAFNVTLLDDTARLLAPETAVTLDNAVYGWFDQGICAITSEVAILSRVIEGDLLNIRGDAPTALVSKAFGVGYESDRKYLMFAPQDDADTTATIAYVYNTITRTFTTFDLAKSAGIINPTNDKMHLADPTALYVSRERKDFDPADIADEAVDVTVTSVAAAPDTNLITLSSVSGLNVDDLFWQSDVLFSKITAIDTGTKVITVLDALAFTTGAAEVRKFFEIQIEYNAIHTESPGIMRQWSEITLLTEQPIDSMEIEFKTELAPDYEGLRFEGDASGLWGMFAWGGVPWGGGVALTTFRTYVPRLKGRSTTLNVRLTQNTVYNDFEVSGLSLMYRNFSSRIRR